MSVNEIGAACLVVYLLLAGLMLPVVAALFWNYVSEYRKEITWLKAAAEAESRAHDEAREEIKSLKEMLDGIASWIPDDILRQSLQESEKDEE